MNKVSVIIPCYNEAQSLPLLHTELCKLAESEQQYEWEFLFINDGSRDTTIDELVKLHAIDERCNYVDLSRNYGKEVALLGMLTYNIRLMWYMKCCASGKKAMRMCMRAEFREEKNLGYVNNSPYLTIDC